MKSSVISKHYDERALSFGKDVRSCQYRSLWSFKQRQQAVLPWFSQTQGKKILDVGCGPGLFSAPLARGNDLVGIDLSLEMLRLAQTDLKAVRGEAASLPFKDHSFDIVLAIEILQHANPPEIFLKEILRVVRPEGEVIISSLNAASFLHRFLKPAGGYDGLHFYFADEINGWLKKEGAENLGTQFLGFPFPWVWKSNGGRNRLSPLAASWVIRCRKK